MRFLQCAVLVLIARVLGARVSQWVRTVEEDKMLNPSGYVSPHRWGEAFDLPRSTADGVLSALGSIANVQWHEKGTAPHWHIEPDERTRKVFWVGVAAIATAIAVIAANRKG